MLANRIHLTIDSNLADVFLVGLLINSASRFVGLDETEAYQMELCVVEAVNNTIRHAYGGQAGHEVAVSAAISPSRLEFSVADRGSPISGDVLACRLREKLRRAREIMREVMDQVDYESRGGVNCLRMTKRIPVPVLEA